MSGPNPPEDMFTNTVEDARKYEAWRMDNCPICEEDDNPYSEADPTDTFGDYDTYEEFEDDGYEFEDYCGCSDPCCPCDGAKYGTP